MMHGTLSRAGRKRKSGQRQAKGRLIVARDLDIIGLAINHPERQGLPMSVRHDQRAGWPLGRLCLARIITDEQLEAARLYARDCQRYQQAIGCPAPNAAALDMARTGGRSLVILSPQEIHLRKETYDAAFQAVWDSGQRCARVVARMAFYGEHLPAGSSMADLIRGLSALVHHYGLTTRRKSGMRNNRS
jgi:hypothetical protein